MSLEQIKKISHELSEYCRRRKIVKLAVFGSALGEDFGPESDLDLLVEFAQGETPGLDFFTIEDELSKLIGRKVDLHTLGFLSPYFRDQVLAEAEVQYAAG